MSVISPELPEESQIRVEVRRRGRAPLVFSADVKNSSVSGPSAMRLGLHLAALQPGALEELNALVRELADTDSVGTLARSAR